MNATVSNIFQQELTLSNMFLNTSNFALSTGHSKIFSDHTLYLFEIIVYTCLCGFVSVIGISTNIINIIIFYRQGVMSDSSNTSLLGLAVADLCCLITMLWHSINFAVILIDPSEISWDPLSVLYITAGWPHVMFTRVTCWITGFIALERCVCVILPFKVKRLFTPTRSLLVIVSVFVVIIITYIPIYYSHRLKWRTLPESNETKLVLVFTNNMKQIENICHYINDVILPTTNLTIVMVCTKITVARINTSSQWRKSNASAVQAPQKKFPSDQNNQSEESQISIISNRNQLSTADNELECSVSYSSKCVEKVNIRVTKQTLKQTNKATNSMQKEKKLTRMMTLICIIFLVCNTPCILIIYLRFAVPEVSNRGRYHNLFFVLYSIDFLLETINSTINILVYYNMSSRYKKEFKKLFSFKEIGTQA